MSKTSLPPDPNGGIIEKNSSKDNLEDYFNNFAVTSTNKNSLLEQLTNAISSLTTNNGKLVAINAKVTTEVTSITKRMRGKAAEAVEATNMHVAKECLHYRKEGFMCPTSVTMKKRTPTAVLQGGRSTGDTMGQQP